MSLAILCTVVFAFYAVIWFFDSFFKSCMHYPYYAFLEGTGLKVGILNFSWTTTAFNRAIYRWGKHLSRLLRKWFTFGTIVTLALFLPFALWTLITLILANISESIEVNSVPEVKAMLPGVNIPMSDFWVYFLALAFSSIFHELGHAMAAVQEDVQLISVGVYVFAIIPVAFVQLNPEHLNSLALGKRLKIYCAGVWHNVATAFISLLLFFAAPILFSILYESGVGLRVSEFTEDSPLKGERGLNVDNVIVAINDCQVRTIHDWQYCLHGAHNRFGICKTAEYVAEYDEITMESIQENGVVECCRKEDLQNFCFEYMEPKYVADDVLPMQYSCLKPSHMVQTDFAICTEASGFICPKNKHCMKPSLNNYTYFIIIQRRENKPVLYLGLPYDVYKTVKVDQYFARFTLLSRFSPSFFEKVLRFVFIFSMGIGFLNIIPCYGSDGHHIARNLIQLLAKYLNKSGDFVTFCTIFTVVIGTGFTWPTLVYLFYRAISAED